MNPKDLYFKFHGKAVKAIKKIVFSQPSTLVYLGRAMSIVYLSDKKHGGGDGKPCEFEHEFETAVHLYMDEKGKRQLYLIGEKLFVNEDGIQN